MADIKNPKVIWAKGILFLVLGMFASVLLVLYARSVPVVLLHLRVGFLPLLLLCILRHPTLC